MNKAELMQHMARGGYRVHQEWGLMASVTPPVDEQPEPEQLGPCSTRNASGESGTFHGTETNPLPLKGK